MLNDTPLYRFSVQDARERDELELWRNSFKANCACCASIEEAIRNGFDGMHLSHDCAKSVIDTYGYQRVEYVLANTLHELSSDGRFSQRNKDWGAGFYIPEDKNRNYCFTVSSHPAVLDGFIDEYRSEYQKLGLFEAEHCLQDSYMEDYTDRVLALKIRTLKEQYWDPKYQLWLANGGFGCKPGSLGSAVFAPSLYDGERARFSRSDFIGPVKDEFLPELAESQLIKLRSGQEIQPTEFQDLQPTMTM